MGQSREAMATARQVEIRILGPLEVWLDGHRIDLGGGRQRALLALLAVHVNEVVSSDRLVDALWEERPTATAHKALQGLVVQLRDAIDPARDGVLTTQAPGYSLRLDPDAVDARRFERLAGEARRLLDADPKGAAQRLRDALSLWRGEALADFAYRDYAQSEIMRLEESRLVATEDPFEADLATGSAAALVPELEALVAAHPLRERLRGALMLALYRSGRQADALSVYRDGRAALQDELGLEPGESLRELEQAILNQDPSLGRPPKLRWSPPRRPRRLLIIGAAVVAAAIAAMALAVVLTTGDAVPAVVPNSILKIDAESNEVVDVIPVGRDPGQVRVIGEYAFVSSEAEKTLTRIAVRSGEVTTSGVSGADGGLAAAGDRFVWATSVSDGRVSRTNVDNMLVVDGVSMPRDLTNAFVAVGGGSLWVSNSHSPAQVLKYSLHTLQLQRRLELDFFRAPFQIAYGHGAAWTVQGFASLLLRIDASSGETSTLSVGRMPSDPAVAFGSVWVAMIGSDTVWRIDPLSMTAASIVKVGDGPFGVATGEGAVWVANNCAAIVSKIDPASDEVVATIDTRYFPRWLDVGHGYVWVGVAAEPYDFGQPVCN